MKIYIAGKVTGEPSGDVFVKFNTVAYQLRRKGLEVVNPIELCQPGWQWERCMITCIARLIECDALFLLPDWQWSKGARLEKEIADGLGMPIFKKVKDITI